MINLFKYCLSQSHMDGMSLSLIKNAIINLSYQNLQPHMIEIMSLIFKRLSIRRTNKFTQGLVCNFMF